MRARILADAISVYVSTLVEKTGKGHSLIRSYAHHDFINKFTTLPIIKKCLMNRHNRSAHEARSYGYFVSVKEILESDLAKWLNEALLFVSVIGKEKHSHENY